MKIVIIKYNAGNVCSVNFALERLGITSVLSDDVNEIQAADKVIFPGVGEASTAMRYLQEHHLDEVIISLKQPVLGICLGMQLMCNHSEEGNTNCLGIFKQAIKKFAFENHTSIKINEAAHLKVPQMGWNTINNLKSKLFKDVAENEYMYFVHSYYAELGEDTIATTNYGLSYSSALQRNNFYATQFHPEKSADIGQKILQNFIAL
ncbi:MAG: imidazole glycerol phosphate synthase subunit HisH [Bacteroidia bacterium]